jgi:hypothetical protein
VAQLRAPARFLSLVTRRPLVLLAVLLTALIASADAAAAAERCKPPRGGTSIAASSHTRVYREPHTEDSTGRAYACNRRTGRRFKLDDPDNGVRMFGPQLAGRYLAYEVQEYIGESVIYTLYRLDLSRAKRRLLTSVSEESNETVWDYRLVKSGAIAWSEITDWEEVGAVWLFGENGKQRLDAAGPELATSFAVSENHRRIYWTNAGEARTALIR